MHANCKSTRQLQKQMMVKNPCQAAALAASPAWRSSQRTQQTGRHATCIRQPSNSQEHHLMAVHHCLPTASCVAPAHPKIKELRKCNCNGCYCMQPPEQICLDHVSQAVGCTKQNHVLDSRITNWQSCLKHTALAYGTRQARVTYALHMRTHKLRMRFMSAVLRQRNTHKRTNS